MLIDMNYLIKALIKPFRVLIVASVVLSSCESDVWKDHYSYKSDTGDAVSSIGATIKDMGDNGNVDAKYFVETLKNTYVYKGNKKTLVTYWDLLTDDQFFTVWLPTKIDETVWLKYAKRNKTPEENIEVGRDFILNHVARFKHSVGTRTYERIKMMNDKSYIADHAKTFHTVGYNRTNIRCTNGLLHVLDNYVPYSPNIYDYLTSNTVYKSFNGNEYRYDNIIGKWIDSFTVITLDPNKSIPGDIDIETGEKTWLDSVVITSNELLNGLKSFINVEDSNYAVVLPSPELWNIVYDSVKEYFSYASGYDGANPVMTREDSTLQRKYTRLSMLTDAFFNLNTQKNGGRDSVTSTLFRKIDIQDGYPYHIYYKPYDDEEKGLFNKAHCIDSVICSNGKIYIRDNWPYSDAVFFKPIKIEAEDLTYNSDFSKATPLTISYQDKRVRVVQLKKNGQGYEMDFGIPNNLKGKYNLKVVFFPKTNTNIPGTLVHMSVQYVTGNVLTVVLDPLERYKKPNGRYATRSKIDTIGVNMDKPDTVTVGPFELPDCNYKARLPKAQLKIKSMINDQNSSNFSDELWLDCIMLEPVL